MPVQPETMSAAMREHWANPASLVRIANDNKRGGPCGNAAAFDAIETRAVIDMTHEGLSSEYIGYVLKRTAKAIRQKRQKLRRDGLL